MSKQTKVVSLNYTPRKWQYELHKKLKRFSVIICHRRAGKTVFVNAEIDSDMLTCPKRNPVYAYVAPTYAQAKKVAWEYFKDALRDIPGFKANESELRIDIRRSWRAEPDTAKIYLLGAENYATLRGMYLDGIVLDEYGDMNPLIWSEVVRPALSDRKGWAIIMGTPKGNNDLKAKWDLAGELGPAKGWYRYRLKASESGILAEDELEAARLEMGDDKYEQEYECSFSAAMTGAYYAKLIGQLREQGRVTDVPYDPLLEVECFWDLGVGDSTAVWFRQSQNGVFHYIDYLEMSGEGMDYYLKKIREKPYNIGKWVFPHDVKQREWSTGVSRYDQLIKKGIRPHVLPKLPQEDRILAARALLPKCRFDEKKCERGLSCLENYTKKYDAKNQIWMDRPLHNWASHGADAFGYSALEVKDNSDIYFKERPPTAVVDYDTFGGLR